MTNENTAVQNSIASHLYLFLSQVSRMIVKVTDEETLFKEACWIAINYGQFTLAWIGLIDEQTKKVVPVTYAGEQGDYLSAINTARDNFEERNFDDLEHGYFSSASLPIKKFEKVIGIFLLSLPAGNFLNTAEIELLDEVTGDISFALEVFDKEKLRKRAEEELLKSQLRYQTLTESSPVGIFHTDANGYTTYVNPRWCQISGMSSEDALGNGWLNAVHPEDKEALVMGWHEATKVQDLSVSEYRFIRPGGIIAWVLGQAVPERNINSEIIGYIGTITDITDHKKAETEIANIYKEKQTVLNRINDAVISVNKNWEYAFLNDAALDIYALEKGEILGKVIWDMHPEIKGTIFWDKYQEAMQAKKAVEFEGFYAPIHTWFYVKVYPSHDGLTIFFRDITDRKKTEEILFQNEMRLSKAQEIGKMGYWQLDLKTNMILASKEAMRIYGLTAVEGEIERKKFSACIIDIETAQQALKNLVENNKPYDIEFRIKTPGDPAIKYISALAELERNEKGEPVRVVGTLQDITERIKAQNEIMKEKNLSDSIINCLPGIFYLYNKEGRFLRWNKNLED
jgi:PAS domain S-box-containing protein